MLRNSCKSKGPDLAGESRKHPALKLQPCLYAGCRFLLRIWARHQFCAQLCAVNRCKCLDPLQHLGFGDALQAGCRWFETGTGHRRHGRGRCGCNAGLLAVLDLPLHRLFDEALLRVFGNSLICDPLIWPMFGIRFWRLVEPVGSVMLLPIAARILG